MFISFMPSLGRIFPFGTAQGPEDEKERKENQSTACCQDQGIATEIPRLSLTHPVLRQELRLSLRFCRGLGCRGPGWKGGQLQGKQDSSKGDKESDRKGHG